MTTAASLRGHSRKLVVVACYLPPGYSRTRGGEALEYIEGTVIELKRRYKDPYVVIAGDFNQWKIQDALANFADIKEVLVGCTRGRKAIDRLFVNFTRSVREYGTLEPLETEGEEGLATKSDHKIAYCKAWLERRQAYKWESFSYRQFNDVSVERFREWIVMHDWGSVLEERTADKKAEAYQSTVVAAVERFFPLKKVRKKDTCLLYTSPSPRDRQKSRMPSSA